MAKSLHEAKILRRVFNRVWDTLSVREQNLVAGDVDRDTAIAKWFDTTVAAETKAKYESPTYWMNEPASFKYPLRQDPLEG